MPTRILGGRGNRGRRSQKTSCRAPTLRRPSSRYERSRTRKANLCIIQVSRRSGCTVVQITMVTSLRLSYPSINMLSHLIQLDFPCSAVAERRPAVPNFQRRPKTGCYEAGPAKGRCILSFGVRGNAVQLVVPRGGFWFNGTRALVSGSNERTPHRASFQRRKHAVVLLHPSADFRPRLCPARLKFPATIGNDLTIRILSGQYRGKGQCCSLRAVEPRSRGLVSF